MTTIEPLRQESAQAYDAFVEAHPGASIFHTRAWAENACASVGAEPGTLVAREGGDVVGVLPLALVSSAVRGRRLLSFPFCRWIVPLGERADTVAALVEAAVTVARHESCRFLELRSGPLSSLPVGARRECFFDGWEVDLEGGEAEVWRRFHARSARHSIRVARRHPVRIHRLATPEGYRILTALDAQTRRRQGVPRHPREFVEGIGRRFESQGRALLLVAEVGGEPIAAELALRHGDAFHGILGVDAGPAARTHRPNHLLIWEAIRVAICEGAKRFDLGPAHRGNVGLTSFKRHFGATPTPADTVCVPIRGALPDDQHLDRPVVTAVRRTLRALPAALHSALSPTLVREVV